MEAIRNECKQMRAMRAMDMEYGLKSADMFTHTQKKFLGVILCLRKHIKDR